jgi:hypothetical protein
MRCRTRILALFWALLALSSCSLGARMHFGDLWLEAGHGLALVGNNVRLAIR